MRRGATHPPPLSILYLRCREQAVLGAVRNTGGLTFNSLFEMPLTPVRPIDIDAFYAAFNSLFEMPHKRLWQETLRRCDMTFNSLFEMRQGRVGRSYYPYGGCFQFSI